MKNGFWEKRIQNIKENAPIRKLIDHFGIRCQSLDMITQVHCPFHGDDLHPSARIYESNSMYCFYCNKAWDPIDFVKDFKNVSFIDSCNFLEDLFNIKKTDRDEFYEKRETFGDYLKSKEGKKEKDFNDDFLKINKCLISNRNSFDLSRYVRYFNLYDLLLSSYTLGTYKSDEALQVSLTNLFKEISRIT